ncbi:glycoside hydrolase superfamily [Aspergillus desertorum]
MMFKHAALALAALPCVASLRFAMYIDEWHANGLPGSNQTQGITHAIMGFAKSTDFAADSPATFRPFEPTRRLGNCTNVAAMLYSTGFDGNGEDYKKVPNEQKVDEIETFPLFLQALEKADMIAYTKEQDPKIWPSVDMINVMSYDLMSRRNDGTKHHSGVADSHDTINAYLGISAPPEKLNLSFANPIGCPTVAMETADGSDNGKSGAMTFETQNLAAPPPDIKVSTDMTCGLVKGTKCPVGSCCSIYGNCGTGDNFCLAACDSFYGKCKGVPIQESWRRAQAEGVTDEEGGGQYYVDRQNHLFWTWDTPALMARKFTDIVDAENLGGVMAWSLGEDTYNFEHLKAMQAGGVQRTGGTATAARTAFRFAVGVNIMRPFILLTFVPLVLALPIPTTNIRIDYPGLTSSLQQQPLFESKATIVESKRFSSKIQHGIFILADKDKPQGTSQDSTSYIHALQTEQAPYRLLERHSDALFALGLLLLIPLTLGVVEMAERLLECMAAEQFPERGREKQRIESLLEREKWTFRRKEPENKSERRSRSWWRWSRH